ncbi:hypothetical protein [Ideonella sp.]|uniref:hypothetical protein n=1 Tax=Ideonella sp. TaxID=1929293 RepID=UPI002B491C44|nr:hypothetical protein [Ideonella sp.]HJV70868.1 hypothetical protein [Ideonella sp.]
MRRGSCPAGALIAVAAAWVLAGAAHAQAQVDTPPPPPVSPPPPITQPQPGPAQPFSIGLSETLTHDSNFFRTSTNEEAEWTSVTALNFGLDQMFGRQRLHGNAALQMNRYKEHDELNNTGHDVALQLDWETAGDLSGVLGAQSIRRQYRFGLDSATPLDDARNIESTQSGYFQGRLGGMGEWALLVGANALDRGYSNATFAADNDLSQWSGEGGIGYKPSPDLGGQLLARYTRISRPDTSFYDDSSRKDLELGVFWQASGASRFDVRLTRSEEKHAVLADRSFWTGGIGWDWAPSGKLRLRTQVLRDIEGGSGNVATPEATMPAVPAGDQLRDAFIWSAQWAATAKINVIGGVQWSRRKLSQLLEVGGGHLSDRTTAVTLGVQYSPARALDLGCNIASERRDSNAVSIADLALTRDYDALAAGCTFQFWFR